MDDRPQTVRAFDDGIDSWRIAEAAPAPSLRDRVGHYSDYWERTASFAARRELASTSGVLIYALGAPLQITGADGQVLTIAAGEAFAGGIADATSLSRGLGAQAGIHVFLPLTSLAALCGAPLAELANRVVAFADLVGRDASDLGDALCGAADAAERFALLDRFLERRFAARDRDRQAAWAMRRLARASGPATSALAEELGCSRKHFIQRFREDTGFSPDRFRRLARFERFTEAIMAAPGDSLAGLAAETGYVDQAHLTRDVRAFADMTPGELRARLIPGQGGVRHD